MRALLCNRQSVNALPSKKKVSVKYGAVVMIFFISGVTMRTETMLETIKDWRMHLFVQAFSLVLVPLLAKVIMPIAWGG